MNWGNIVRFRKQVEDMIKEELALAEWAKSQEIARQQTLQVDIQAIASELERNLPHGVDGAFAAERYRWLDEATQRLEQQVGVLEHHDKKIDELQGRLREAYQARRIVELMMTKQKKERQRHVRKNEQREHDDLAALRLYTALGEKS